MRSETRFGIVGGVLLLAVALVLRSTDSTVPTTVEEEAQGRVPVLLKIGEVLESDDGSFAARYCVLGRLLDTEKGFLTAEDAETWLTVRLWRDVWPPRDEWKPED